MIKQYHRNKITSLAKDMLCALAARTGYDDDKRMHEDVRVAFAYAEAFYEEAESRYKKSRQKDGEDS